MATNQSQHFLEHLRELLEAHQA